MTFLQALFAPQNIEFLIKGVLKACVHILPVTSLLHEVRVMLSSTLLASLCDPTFPSIIFATSLLKHHPLIHPYPFLSHPGSLPYQP